jgi:hypothetical protein
LQPDPVVWYLDENVCGRKLTDALRSAGAVVERATDHFERGTADGQWIPEVTRRGWVILTTDHAIRYRQAAPRRSLPAIDIVSRVPQRHLFLAAEGRWPRRPWPNQCGASHLVPERLPLRKSAPGADAKGRPGGAKVVPAATCISVYWVYHCCRQPIGWGTDVAGEGSEVLSRGRSSTCDGPQITPSYLRSADRRGWFNLRVQRLSGELRIVV